MFMLLGLSWESALQYRQGIWVEVAAGRGKLFERISERDSDGVDINIS